MYLKRLEIQGFKTFATRTIFAFRPGITAIIGPNGSGKSNLADAVRWVLGEQNYSTLRSKRTEDLIFGGGGRRASAGFAEVSLTIDNSDRLLPLPYNEVTFTRRATRAGDNEYFINRSRVRLRDIQTATAPLGGSYTIINQGLVDAALTLRPEERRRLFEDAAEISVFETRKADVERRLRETDTNVTRCADTLTDLEPRLRSLKRQASLARTHREFTTELHSLLQQHYCEQWHANQHALVLAEAAERATAHTLSTHRADQAAATAALREHREALRNLREHLGALHAESSRLHTRAEGIQRDLAVGNERQTALARRSEELERDQRDIETRYHELEHERATTAQRLADAEARHTTQRAAVAACEQHLATHANERRAAQRSIETAQRAELEASAALNECQRRARHTTTQRERLLSEQANRTQLLDAADQTLATQRQALDQAQERAAEAAEQHTQAVALTERARVDLETQRTERTRLDEQIAHTRRTQADIETRLETLTRLQQNHTGAFAGVKAAMQWAETNQRNDFRLVSTLIHVPAHLETAIEVALGNRLQNIVVEHWSDAEAAIDALKRGGQGRATFLPLDTIGGRSTRGLPTDLLAEITALDPHAGIAAELVTYEPRYEPIAAMLLGRTLIAHDLPIARRILNLLRRSPAHTGWNIVTLGGEQVSGGGAVTGGAQTKESGTLRRERALRELPAQRDAQRTTLAELLATRADLDRHFALAEQTLQQTEAKRRHTAQHLETQRETVERTRRLVERAESEHAWQHRHHQQIATDLSDLDAQLHALTEEHTYCETHETEARTHLAQLRLQDQERIERESDTQRHLADLRAAASTLEGEARAERALLQSHTHNLARLAEQRAAIVRRSDELAHQRTAIAREHHALDATHTALLAQIDDLRTQIGPAETELLALETTQAEHERREAELTSALIASEAAHSRATSEVQRIRDRCDALWERAAADDIDIEAVVQPTTTRETTASPPLAEQTEQIERLRERIRRIGVVNPLALEEYDELSERYTFLTTQIDDLRRAETSLRELLSELDDAMRSRFETTFHAVAAEFERSFTRLFGGGHAQLVLTHSNSTSADNEQPDSTIRGVDIIARPPGKRQQTLSLLSGGERSLTASALLFAILRVNPSPFCILDEVDAALDEANIGRFREALLELTDQTQFLLITHNRSTIEAADTIYGVSMGDDSASKILSLRLEELVEEKDTYD